MDVDARTAHHYAVADAPLLSRVRAHPAYERTPTAVGVAAATTGARLAWRCAPRARAEALAWARAVLGPGAPAPAVERLARRHLIERSVSSELGWRPRAGRAMAIDGFHHLARAREHGRGAIVAFVHSGPFILLLQALGARGVRTYLQRPQPLPFGVVHGAEGAWRAFQRAALEDAGCRTVSRGGAFATLAALLRRGEVVVIAFDSAGDVPAELLGRTAWLKRSVAGLHAETRAPVVPALVWRDRARPRARFDAPLAGDVMPALVAKLDTALRERLPAAYPMAARLFSPPPAARGRARSAPRSPSAAPRR